VYRERFHLVAQRLDRSKLFSRPALSAAGGAAGGVSHGVELTPLQALLGTAGATRFVLGSLSLLDDGRYWLEDTTGAVAVDLTRAATAAGLFTENCVVVAEGELRRDGVFQARRAALRSLAQSLLADLKRSRARRCVRWASRHLSGGRSRSPPLMAWTCSAPALCGATRLPRRTARACSDAYQ
jgi:hypothetical protein